ncbi:GNAT family N-acetyltransferase [Actinomadura rubrisoli]|uniref:N-acetyltransferase n=1 Tax=Actinomadura rubrisoli TaxID=2530368 RepID=A0A4R5C476_9ACTN|nr:GNAT family N-acetyltransferase [Actinomadura rubrisoli]TDD91704.1 N-acetyltransferase [Actinomadura rubrisoli]
MTSSDAVELIGHGLVLREWSEEDLDALTAMFDDPEIAYWTPVAAPFDKTAAQNYLDRIRWGRAQDDRVHLAITTDGREPKGEVMLNKSTGTIGYAVGAAYRGQRLAYRAVLLMTEYAHRVAGLARVSLEIEPDNAASAGVARAVGYRLTDAAPVTVEDKGRRHTLLTWVHEDTDHDGSDQDVHGQDTLR